MFCLKCNVIQFIWKQHHIINFIFRHSLILRSTACTAEVFFSLNDVQRTSKVILIKPNPLNIKAFLGEDIPKAPWENLYFQI